MERDGSHRAVRGAGLLPKLRPRNGTFLGVLRGSKNRPVGLVGLWFGENPNVQDMAVQRLKQCLCVLCNYAFWNLVS